MKRIRKILLTFLCLCMMFNVSMIVYAANDETGTYDSTIATYKSTIEQTIAELEDEETVEIYQKVVDYIFSDDVKNLFMKDGEGSTHYTIKAGYKIIEAAIKKTDEGKNWWERLNDANTSFFQSYWKTKFRSEAEAYGIEYGNVFGTQGSDADEVENAAIKVNMLTWNRDKKNDGTAIIQKEQGVIMRFLRALDTFSDFTTWTRGIAVALTITFGCSTLLTMVTDRNLSTEALQREFLKILFGVWFIMNFRFFALLIIRLGTLITENVLVTDFNASKGEYVYLTICQSLSELIESCPNIASLNALYAQGAGPAINTGNANILSGFASTISNWIGGGLVQMVSSLTVYAVIIEIGVRYIFTPIAIADLYSERFRSSGWAWLKKLFACSMQGAVIFMIIFGVNTLKEVIGTFDPITNAAINLTMIGMFAKSRQVANDMIGVH